MGNGLYLSSAADHPRPGAQGGRPYAVLHGDDGPGEGDLDTETAVRELYEETGLIVKPEALEVVHIIHGALGVEAPNGFLTVVFAVHEWTGEPENREPRKHAQVCWVGVDVIPEDFVSTTASALRGYLTAGPQVSLDGWK
ncbi:MAG: NUDIX domain-containing protein [Streptomyces sp.]|nr:NUDIX domain-containing protein [Streptomyces sp.]